LRNADRRDDLFRQHGTKAVEMEGSAGGIAIRNSRIARSPKPTAAEDLVAADLVVLPSSE